MDQFGLVIYNANVKQLQDTQGSEYFSYLKLKTHEGAVNQAKIDVATAKAKGDIGETERKGATRKETIRIEADTAIFENERYAAMSKTNSELKRKEIIFENSVKIKKIEALKAEEIREAELQKGVEIKRAELETEKLRADEFTKAKIEAESLIQRANASLYEQEKESEGILAMYQAQAEGLKSLSKAFNNDKKSLLKYLMMEKGLLLELAKENANAIQGLNPKISVWNTESINDSSIRGLFQSLAPTLTTFQEQSGINPPNWMATMSNNNNNTATKTSI